MSGYGVPEMNEYTETKFYEVEREREMYLFPIWQTECISRKLTNAAGRGCTAISV